MTPLGYITGAVVALVMLIGGVITAVRLSASGPSEREQAQLGAREALIDEYKRTDARLDGIEASCEMTKREVSFLTAKVRHLEQRVSRLEPLTNPTSEEPCTEESCWERLR